MFYILSDIVLSSAGSVRQKVPRIDLVKIKLFSFK